MAADHVDVYKNNENITIFNIFDRLIKSSHKKEKSCAAFIDFLKWSDQKVGSANASAYSAKRLVRGLAASETERQNIFFSVLCTALSNDTISTENVFNSLENVVNNTGSSKSEQTAILVTKVLTYGAIVKTRKLYEMSPAEQTIIIEFLASTSNSKNYVKTAASTFLLDFVNDLSKPTMKNILLPAIKKEFKSGNGKSIEHEFSSLCAVAYLKFPRLMQKIIDLHFGGRDKFYEDVCGRCSYFSVSTQEQVLRLLCLELSSEQQLIRLWNKLLVDDHKSNNKWNSYILLFFKMIMDVAPNSEMISNLLHPTLIDILLKSLQVHDKNSKKELTYIRAKEVLEKFVVRVVDKDNSDSNFSLNALKTILSHPGGLQFDRKTRTSTVSSIIAHLNASDVKKLADEFVSMLSESMSKNKKGKTSKEMELILSMLMKLLNNSALKKDSSLVFKYIKCIFDIAFLKSVEASPDLRAKSTDIFYKCLELNQIKIEDAVAILNNLIFYADDNKSALIVQIDNSQQWNNMLDANNKLAKKANDKKYAALRLLLLHMGLLMFRDQSLASSTIEELLQCYQRIKEGKKKNLAKDSDQEPHWVEVTVDLLLAMLSRENKLLRHVVSSVFPSIVPHLTATALQQIIDALDPGSRNDVLKHLDSDDSDDEAGEEESDEEDEVESAESAVEGEEETVNDKLRMAVRNALGYSAALTDDESVDMDDMNEEEEKRLNENLASAFLLFRPSKGSKKKQSKDDEALTHFRVRVLDLVEIIVTTNPPVSSCLELLNPLFHLLEFSIKDPHQKPLQNRLETILKKLGGVKKFQDESLVAYSDLVASLKGLFERETSGLVSVEMAPTVAECCVMLVRAAQVLDLTPEGETLEDVFGNLLIRFFKKNDRKIPYSMFQSVLRMLWDGNWDLSQRVMELILDPDLKLFKKFKLVELLEIFYKNDRLQSTATDDNKKTASSFEAKFVKKFSKSLEEYDAKKKSKLLPTFYSRLLNFVQLALRAKSRYRGNCASTPAWASVVAHLLQRIHLLPQQKSRNKLLLLAQQYNIPVPDKGELEAKKVNLTKDELSDEDNAPENKRKKVINVINGEDSDLESQMTANKKKIGMDARKRKQEARDLREAVSSQGLVPSSFIGVDVEALDDEEMKVGPASPKTKKVKKNEVIPEKKRKKQSK